MTALLRALGVVVWSLAASGLLVVGGMIGFRALHPGAAVTAGAPSAAAARPISPAAVSGEALPAASASSPGPAAGPDLVRRSPFDATLIRNRFRAASARHDAASIIENGRVLHEHGVAGRADFTQVALAFATLGDCSNALAWMDKAATAPADQRIDPALTRASALCRPEAAAARPVQPAGGRSGDHEVHIGELFYAINDYSRAILFLQKGLALGGVTHADEAYVYLGRSYLALHQYAEACEAFDTLRQVPGASPRVVRLWTLYADTRCTSAPAD